MNRYKYLLLLPLLLSACRDDSMRIDIPLEDIGMEVRLQAEIDQLNLTRADDSGFADGDVIGVFAVDFVNGQPGQLSTSGNNADNVAFTFDENSYRWNGASAILFSDDKTPMDLYGYYPYSKSVDNVEAYPVSVEYNQSGDSKSRSMSAYEASDFLWAKTAGLTQSGPTAILYFKHVLASVRVTLLEGDGFVEGEWNNLDKSVLVCNTSRDATINLSTGEVKASSQKDGRSIVAKGDRSDFRAIVIPQSVEAGSPILNITVGAKSYEFKKSEKMTFNPTKQHNFTVQVNKTTTNGDYDFTLVDEAITSWESDLTSHNGAAKEYIVIENPEGGLLSTKINEMKFDPTEIINLKIKGAMNEDDFEYIRSHMTNIEAVNIFDVDLSAIDNRLPDSAFEKVITLKTCVLPDRIKIIGNRAFYETSLTGSLSIPEGVIEIGDQAYCNGYSYLSGSYMPLRNNLKGTLTLPSTLKKIGVGAFTACDFSGELLLPEGIEYIGGGAFQDCIHFSNVDLHLPESLIECSMAFWGMTGISGWIYMPSKLKTLSGWGNLNVEGIVWPDAPLSIERNAFNNFSMKAEFIMPESVLALDDYSFFQSKIKHIVFSPKLTKIPSCCFMECLELSDTLKIPAEVDYIYDQAFYKCSKLEAIILPKSLNRIGSGAFAHCFGVNYIRCEAKEPPVIDDPEYTLYGIAKDNFAIEVPEGCVEAYRNAPGWSEFKRIEEYRNFVARPSKFNLLNNGGNKEIILNADTEWEMTECPSWCHIDKPSGSKKTMLTLKVDAMSKGTPVRDGKITFRLKGSSDYTTHINVCQYDYEYDEDQYLTLQSASKGKGINLVFLGDGYDAYDISSGLYLSDMKQEMEYFFGIEPYASYRDYFNVYTVISLSDDSGVESINSWRNTKFDVTLGDGKNMRLSANWQKALDYCAECIPETLKGVDPSVGCIVVCNTDRYEGITYNAGDSFCSVVTKSAERYPLDARGLIQHEAGGHGIGWLGDEYIYHTARIQNCGCECCQHVFELINDHSWGFALNLSLTGKYQEVPWKHLIFHTAYGDIVDVYEGGFFHSRGVYRSEKNTCMNNNVPYFSTWSRQLIVQRIMKLAGEQFDLNSFYAKDSRAVGCDFKSTSRSGASKTSEVSVRHGNAPIMIKGYKYGKKGGRK